ncbi:hypothetical protein BDZ97DRAFT_1306848 [Flammula alnicola]|nr:hypothetical protein BDZ97DRAFT_1418181 [Flammula alnicola]KAF8960411.1 hypothetical protein BDZ97DRAFT_1306848 [Flammula alnicola]
MVQQEVPHLGLVLAPGQAAPHAPAAQHDAAGPLPVTPPHTQQTPQQVAPHPQAPVAQPGALNSAALRPAIQQPVAQQPAAQQPVGPALAPPPPDQQPELPQQDPMGGRIIPDAPPVQYLYADPALVESFKLAAAKGNGKDPVDEMVPGFKADPLAIPIPPKVDEAFKAFKYVPYSSLTSSERLKAARGEEEMVISASGGFLLKGLDRRNERSISFIDWVAAARAAENRTRMYQGDRRADALASHHMVVQTLAQSHGWPTALEYDINQREAAALHPAHDLTGLNSTALTLISTRTTSFSAAQSSSPSKRGAVVLEDHSPRKHARTEDSAPSRHCFRCGATGHFPADCSASTTVAGKPCLTVATGLKSRNTLLTAEGRQFCFGFARSGSCRFGHTCSHSHSCSICYSTSHGAASCRNARA